MRVLQRNLQSVQFSMSQKTDEEKENQDRDEGKVRISYDESERCFNCDDSFVCLNFKRHCDLNKKKHEAKNEQIIERTSFQQIRSALLKAKRQHESVREEKAFWRFFEKRNINEKSKKSLRLDGA